MRYTIPLKRVKAVEYQKFTIDDVKTLSSNPSDESKIELIRKLHDNFNLDSLSVAEKQIAEEILRFLASDISARIRHSISQKFSDNSALPYDVALKLATDLEDIIAIPVIQNSKILKDADLVNIIKEGKTSRQIAVASRPNLSENVNSQIISEAAPEAVETLIKNPNSRLSESNAEQIIKFHNGNNALVKTLIQSKKINAEQAHSLLVQVSEDLQKMLIVEYQIPATTVNNLIHNSKEWVILSMIKAHAMKHANCMPLKDIIDRLHRENELSFSLLIKALSLGDLSFFEAAIAKMADIPIENVRKLIWEAGDLRGYEGLYNKCKLPESMSAAVYRLLQIVKAERDATIELEGLPYRIFQKISAAANLEDIENIDYLVTIVAYNLKKSQIS